MNNHSPLPAAALERRPWGRWLITAAWAALIFFLSTAGFGSSFTEQLLRLMLATAHIQLSPAGFAILHFLVRKSAHLTEYGIFSLLIYASLMGTDDYTWHARTASWSVAIAGLYSLTDEFHQRFVPGRTPALHDCAIDTAGALVGIAGVYGWARLRRARSRSPAIS